MGELNILYVAIGAIALAAGIGVLVRAIRSKPGESPKATAMLIGGMMLATFGLLMAGFSIGYALSDPIGVNAEATS